MTNCLALLEEVEKWSSIYEFSFQFWGADNNNVFISKGGIDLTSFGGFENIETALKESLKWCNTQNPKGFKKQEKSHRCAGCGCRIAVGNDFCGECLCED